MRAFTTGSSRVGGRRRESARRVKLLQRQEMGEWPFGWQAGMGLLFSISLSPKLSFSLSPPLSVYFFLFYSKIFRSKLIKYVVYGVNKHYFISWIKLVNYAMQRVWLVSLKFGSQTDMATAWFTCEPNFRLTIVCALILAQHIEQNF